MISSPYPPPGSLAHRPSWVSSKRYTSDPPLVPTATVSHVPSVPLAVSVSSCRCGVSLMKFEPPYGAQKNGPLASGCTDDSVVAPGAGYPPTPVFGSELAPALAPAPKTISAASPSG